MVPVRPKVHRSDGEWVEGKGFSPGELKEAGSSLTDAVRYHIPVDSRRKTVHDENVAVLKPIIDQKKAAAKAKLSEGKSKS